MQIAGDEQICSALAEWRDRTGQDFIRGRATGLWASPPLNTHAAGVHARDYIGMKSLHAFRPLTASHALTGGIDLGQVFGLGTGTRDFFGHRLPTSGRWPMGAVCEPVRSAGRPQGSPE